MLDAHMTPLPDFERPPLVEVALSVQFNRLESMRAVDLGLLWAAFRDRYPHCEEMPPLEPIIESFGGRVNQSPGIQVEVLRGFVPRLWLVDESGSGLVQVQPDRFAYNWRAAAGDVYPRYSQVRERFQREFDVFRTFVATHLKAAIEPNLCEVAYVNIIPSGDGEYAAGELDKVLTCFAPRTSDGYLAAPASVSLDLRYPVAGAAGAPAGSLQVSAKPVVSHADGQSRLMLDLVARSLPATGDVEGILACFDLGRETIVRAFASLTTPEMHDLWGRRDNQ
jgi:uncharacterized protein (TIGR04255 family)